MFYSTVVIVVVGILSLYGCTERRQSVPVQSKQSAPVQRGTIEILSSKRPVEKKTTAVNRKHIPKYHLVKKGDTLYSIAWRYRLDPKKIAIWNEIKVPYTIYINDKLFLMPGFKKKNTTRFHAQNRQAAHPREVTIHNHHNPQITNARWTWPTKGTIRKIDSPLAKNGICITGKLNQKIHAAQNGEVVYAGSNLSGYGRLIIIKHPDDFMTAYARNNNLLVDVGEHIQSGQAIAEMGQGFDNSPMVYFEIRKNGKPVNPLSFLSSGK